MYPTKTCARLQVWLHKMTKDAQAYLEKQRGQWEADSLQRLQVCCGLVCCQ